MFIHIVDKMIITDAMVINVEICMNSASYTFKDSISKILTV